MEKENQKIPRYLRLTAIFSAALLAVVCIAAALIVPRTLHALAHAEVTLSSMDELLVTADDALTTAGDTLRSATEAADAANRLVEDNAGAVSEAMEKINAIDFDALNRAINDLADIVEPLARFANILR